MTPMNVAIVSGGADSTVMLHFLVKDAKVTNIQPVAFQYGQRHDKELECAKFQALAATGNELKIIDLTEVGRMLQTSALTNSEVDVPHIKAVLGDPQPVTYVPNRNMMFLSVAAAITEGLGGDRIFYGAQKHDMYGYWDTTPQFAKRMQDVFDLNRRSHISLVAPLLLYTKADVVRAGVRLGVDFAQTWSCYQGREKACGTCPTCAERLNAFKEVGIVDPIPYEG